MDYIKSRLKNPSRRYLVIGSGVYIFELGVIIIAQWSGAEPVKAIGISFCLGTLLSFLLQKFVTFGDKRVHHKVLVPQFVAICCLVVFNFGFTLFLAQLLSGHIYPVVSRTIALLITTFWNFYIYKTRIFNHIARNRTNFHT